MRVHWAMLYNLKKQLSREVSNSFCVTLFFRRQVCIQISHDDFVVKLFTMIPQYVKEVSVHLHRYMWGSINYTDQDLRGVALKKIVFEDANFVSLK